ncbi:MAG: hydroxymethylbilane synthase, partial [Pseudomonadota bacterium]|nr:hydroxymethylbilane synthase [Pseudomonadota bacterium]
MNEKREHAGRPALRIGTRGSILALAQAQMVADGLRQRVPALAAPDAIEIVKITSTGDRVRDRPLAEIGGKALFAKEIEEALAAGAIDCGVHSLKDMETDLIAGSALVAVLPRADPRDALIGPARPRLDDLAHGAVVGTTSVRRKAFLLARRPDLSIVMFRGNVETRLAKLADGEADATLLAVAGLQRLGMADLAARALSVADMPPAVAQGAIGVQARLGGGRDGQIRGWLETLDHPESHHRVTAERAMLAALSGTCGTPVSGLATLTDGQLTLTATLARADGGRLF